MIKFIFLVFLASCASTSKTALFPLGKQRHEVRVYGADGTLNAQSTNLLIVEAEEARITSLSPAAFTSMKAIAKKSGDSEILYLNPMLEKQRRLVEALLERLSKLLWARGTPSDVRVLSRFEDGTAQELEWFLAKQRVLIRVEKL